jgi:non-specific serine/threonine protein kinase/serine/threonine-protein kinase
MSDTHPSPSVFIIQYSSFIIHHSAFTMTPEKWEKAKDVFQSALALSDEAQTSFIADACADDAEMRSEVQSLIAAFQQAGSFIEMPAAGDAIKVLDNVAGDAVKGQRIGPYRVEKQLGRGGMGIVYLAVRADEQYERQVAIKLVKRGLDSDFIIKRFLSERQILANLEHPNVARLIDGGKTEDGSPYLVMEHIDGVPLDLYCDQLRLSVNERLNLFRTVCSAVQYAHQHLVIHRDLKPSNILVTREGSAKLLDFGVAKILSPDPAAQLDRTSTMMRLLTPDYASPEQLRGESITTSSDVYALGVLLYKLLTGHHPYRFDPPLPQEIERVVCEQNPPKPSTAISRAEEVNTSEGITKVTPELVSEARNSQPEKLRRLLGGDLDNIVLMALRKEPPRRYATVEQFSEDIRRHLEGLPVIARKDTFGYRAGKFVGRHKVGVAAAALVVLTLLAGVVITIREERKAQRLFDEVRALANSIIFEFHDSIANLPGSTPARELLVKRGLEYLDSLAREAGDDTSLQRELVAGYLKIGNVQGNPNNANLGDRAGAMQSYGKALAIAEHLTTSQPGDVQAKRSLALVHEKISDLQDGSGEVAEAVQSSQRSLALFKALADAEPADAKAQQSLAICYIKLGDFLGNPNFPNLGDRSGAMRNYRSSEAIWQSLEAASPNGFNTRRFLGLIYERLGGLLETEGNFAEALESYRTSLTIREQLAVENPTNTDTLRDVAIAHEKIGSAMAGTGKLAAALESRRTSLEDFDRLARADPKNVQAQRSLAISYDYMGDLLGNPDAANLGRHEEALKSYQQALKILQSEETDPGNAETRRFLGHTHERIGALLAAQGKIADALAAYQNSSQFLESLLASEPANPTTRRELTLLYTKLGEAKESLATHKAGYSVETAKLWTEAHDWYQKAADMLLDLRQRDALLPNDTVQQDKLTAKLRDCNQALERLQKIAK